MLNVLILGRSSITDNILKKVNCCSDLKGHLYLGKGQSKYIILLIFITDDEPDDGVDHYIVIYGFHQPHLFGLLAELNIHVSSIVSVNSQDYSRFTASNTDEQPIEKDEKTLGKDCHALLLLLLSFICTKLYFTPNCL